MPRPKTTGEVADRLGVTPSTVRRWEERGLLQATRTAGGHRRFTREEIDKLEHELETYGEDWTR